MPRPRPAAETANAAPPPQTAPVTDAAPPLLEAYRRRIAELRGYGAEEDIAISPDSELDFLGFIESFPAPRPAALFLQDNGNLRAVWDDAGDAASHLALEFLGGRRAQYVIFRRRPGAAEISRVAGTDSFAGISRQIAEFDLWHLVDG